MPLLVLLIILLLLLLGAGYYFAHILIYPHVYPFEETRQKAVEWGILDEQEYAAWPREELTIPSPYGYALAAVYHPYAESQRTVVISHGITFSRYGSIKYAALFYKRGYNVLVYDLRHHGRSGGPNTSFGYYEKYDLKAVVDWAFSRLGPGGVVGTLGESLGAATTLQHAAIDPRISFAISDCAYASLPDLLKLRLHADYHLPPFPLLPLADFFTGLIGGWHFSQASPIRFIAQVDTPIFFAHGQQDMYIPPQASVELFQAKRRGYRELYLAANAGHAEALSKNPKEYDVRLGAFLDQLDLGG